MKEFRFASQRLEHLFPLVGVCARFGAAENMTVAFRTLVRLQQQYSSHHDTLVSWHERCAAVSDGQTTVPGWNSHHYSSAHEAALGVIRTALSTLFIPVISDEGEFDVSLGGFTPIPVTDEIEQQRRFVRLIAEHGNAFDLEPGWVSSLQERIRRERNKLFAASHTVPSTPASQCDALTDDEYGVLLALRDHKLRRLKVADIAEAADLQRATCSKVLVGLANRGLVEYDSTKRQGAGITKAGLMLIEGMNP